MTDQTTGREGLGLPFFLGAISGALLPNLFLAAWLILVLAPVTFALNVAIPMLFAFVSERVFGATRSDPKRPFSTAQIGSFFGGVGVGLAVFYARVALG